MRLPVLFLLFLTSAVAQEPEATPTPPVDPKISLKVSVVGDRREFHMGEIIPIKLAFTSGLKDRYQINEAQYDRSGRMNYETFRVVPADGAVDPLDAYFNSGAIFLTGGLTNYSFLTKKPWTIRLNLNEWVGFTKPGEYKLTISSERVEVTDRTQPNGTRPVTTRSSQITLKILPVDHAWEKQAYNNAVAILRAAHPRDFEDYESSAYHAIETLRYLGTADAARELVKQLRGDRAADSVCYFGLISSPARAVAREALDQALADPDRPLGGTLLDALSWFETGEAKLDQKGASEKERRFLEKVAGALPNKRGEALRVSLYSILDRALIHDPPQLPNDVIQKLVARLVAIFDQLPIEKQQAFLGWRWEEIKSPALVPTLKRFAETDLSKVPRTDYVNGLWRTEWALRRWYELDPIAARTAIIREITRPHPLFSANTLGILPEKTLPEVDEVLAEHFASDNSSELASLIARYATGTILPKILQKIDQRIAEGECLPEGALAYILRVDPVAAKPRIEKSTAPSRKKRSQCTGPTLTNVAAIHYDPVLEEIAIRALANSDAAMDAASMLAKFGSTAVEAPLWRRYEEWSRRWAGRESELTEAGLGQSLCEALGTGQAWLSDKAKLRRLAAVNNFPTTRYQAERYLERWNSPYLTLSIHCSPSFSADLAQYNFKSMDTLKRKLAQFPAGTKFVLWSLSISERNKPCVDEIRTFLISHTMSLEDEKPPE